MKYSICIVTYMAEASLRRCLDSINASSIEDAEIVVWDNSPTPLFKSDPEKAWSPRIPLRVFYQEGHNFGFSEGCNRCAKQAFGEILIFLNPDTVVYGDWAAQLAKHYFAPSPNPIGAIGPISNFVAGFQHVDNHIQQGETPEETAALAARALKGRSVDTKLLIGFCLMMEASVYREVGGMDRHLTLGCDDLDLSLRLRRSGYDLLIASDVFVYHEGHKSFEAAGEDSIRMLNESEARFRDKLLIEFEEQDNIPSSTELWGCEIFYTGPVSRQSVSVVMIVRDEEDNLRELLPQLEFADEIVVVDTKPTRAWSTTEFTPVILSWLEATAPRLKGKFKVDIYHWCDDFARARNHALSLATKDWVLWLDADDRVPAVSGKLIRAALDTPGPYMAQKKCHLAFGLKDFAPNGHHIIAVQQRMFPRLPGLYWEHPIHENYGDRANALGLHLVVADNIIIEHHGYADPVLTARKQERNLAILRSLPAGPHKFLHMGNSFMALGQYKDAREVYTSLIGQAKAAGIVLADGLESQVRYMIAVSYYKEFNAKYDVWKNGEPGERGPRPEFPVLIDYLCEDNEKPDSLFLLAEAKFFAGDFSAAHDLYARYEGLHITDPYGTNADTLQRAALGRMEVVKQAIAKEPA